MNIEIKKLTPDLAEDYVRFFDVTPHGDYTNENVCYYVTWRNDNTYVGNGDHWYPTREERRERAIKYVKDGSIQGYLAYQDDKIVGWCNASAGCQLGVATLRSWDWPIEENRVDTKVKSIFCFAITPDVHRMGVATKLVERICRDAADDGFDFVEAYADKQFTNVLNGMRGPLAMYEKCGFNISAEKDGKIVMRKALEVKP